MLKKIVISIFIILLLAFGVFAQTAQTITLKPGFNFISFTASISSTPAQLKTQNPAIEDIYLFSAAAGSFLSATEGTLSTLSAGKGYIIKSNSAYDTVISIPGDAVQTIGNINLKTGFNLIGFSKIPATTLSFSSLMNVYPAIKGIYKWSPAAGSFIQVVRDNSGAVTQLDGADPSFKAGDSYFFNMAEDTTINYDGSTIILGNGPPAPIEKTLELTGTVGASPAAASPSYSLARAIDLSAMQISVYDEINNSNVEGATITATGNNTFKATLPVATADRYLSVLVKNSDNKVVYKSFLGRIPKATEVTENTVKISNIKVSDESTARAIIVLENRSKITITAVIAKKSVDTSVSNTDFALALEERIAGLEDRVPELKLAVNLIANVLMTPGVDNAIKEKITEFTFSESSKLLSSYVSLLQDADTLQTVNNISVPAQLYIGSKQITAQSTQTDIYETVTGINNTIVQRVEMPIFEPISGQYTKEVSITISCKTVGAKIRFETNGNEPQSFSNEYTSSVQINKSTVFKAIAFKEGMYNSKCASAEYKIIDNEPTDIKISELVLSKTTDSIQLGLLYDLDNINVTAKYSSGFTRTITPTWKISVGDGTIENYFSYINSATTGETILLAEYTENGTTYKAIFSLTVFKSLKKLLSFEGDFSIPWFSTVKPGEQTRLSRVMRAKYSDGSYKDVQTTSYIKEGNGTLTNEDYYTFIYTAPAFEDDFVKVELNYTEDGVILSHIFNFVVSNDSSKKFRDRKKVTINSNNSQISLYGGATLNFSHGNAVDSAEIIFSEYLQSLAMAQNATSLFELKASGNYSGTLEIIIPLENPDLNIDCIYLGAIDDITGKSIKIPIRKEYLLTAPSLNKVNRFEIQNVVIATLIPGTILAGTTSFARTLRYFVYKPEKPINDSKILDVPFYRQYYNECTLASLLMCLKSLNVRSSVYEMAREIGVDIKDKGTLLLPYIGHVEKINSYLKKFSRSLIDISSLTRCRGEFLNKYIIKPLDAGVPVIVSYPKSFSMNANFNLLDVDSWDKMVTVNTGHSFVVVGYKGGETIDSKGDYSNLRFYIHDPSNGAFLEYTYTNFIREFYSDLRTLAWTISSFTPQNYLTLHMPDGKKMENSGIGYKLNKDDTVMTDAITWNYNYENGYIFENTKNMSLPSNFYELNFNSIPIFSIFDQPKTLSIVSAIYNQNGALITYGVPKEIVCNSIKGNNYNNSFHEYTSNGITAENFNNELITKDIYGRKFQLCTLLLYPSQITINPLQTIYVNYAIDYFKVDFVYEKLLLTANNKYCQELTIGSENIVRVNSYINSKANPEPFTTWSYAPDTQGSFSTIGNELTYVSPKYFNNNFSFDVIAKYKSPNYAEELNTKKKN